MYNASGMGNPSPRGWLGTGLRLLATLFFLAMTLALNRCGMPTPVATPTPPSAEASAHLAIEVQPQGARVLVNELRSGNTPASLVLAPGQYSIRVEMEGYQALERSITLAPGDEAAITGELVLLATPAEPTLTPTPTPSPPSKIELPDLAIRSVRIELETGGACDYTSTNLGVAVVVENGGATDAGPFAVEVNGVQQMVDEGLAVEETVRLWFPDARAMEANTVRVDATNQLEEGDESNNTFSEMLPVPTLPPTCTPETDKATPSPTATATPLPSPPVTFRERQITIPTYPYADFLTEAWNETFNMPYTVLDRAAYEASNPSPRDVTYRTYEVENDYLKLVFLPDLGGRLYEVIYKPTGHRQTYRNPVLKPSPWGPPEQGWWLAAGGIEWCLPVEEHGYEWGIPWSIKASNDGKSVVVILRDTTAEVNDRLRVIVSVRLEVDSSSFTIQTRLENPTDAPLDVKYWINAMLAPGGQNAPSADLRFVLPDTVQEVTVHSRGDDRLPGYGEQMPWPEFDGADLSRLANWNHWLGFFEDPATGEFMAVYDETYDEGMVRVFPAEVAQGAKVFGLGWAGTIPADNWTDGGSSYVELHGGLAPTFDDSVTLPAGGHLEWSEIWYPVAGLGGLRYANQDAALNLSTGNGQAQIAAAVPRSWAGDIVLLLNGEEISRQTVSLSPGQPFNETVTLGDNVPASGQLALQLEAPDGAVVAEYSTDFELK